MMQEEASKPVADPAEATEAVPEIANGFGEFVSRVAEGDVGADTWVLLWSSVGQPVLLALVLIVAVLLGAGWVSRITDRALTRARVEPTLSRFLANLVRYLVLLIGGVAILGTLGVETTSFAAALAAAGFAIGMALSGTLSNVAAGIMLLLFRPFKVGDAVTVNGVTARVYQINLFNTEFDTFDNRRVIMPNGSVFGNTIENISYHKTRRVEVNVGTTYSSNIDQAREVLMRAARGTEGILGDPEPVVLLLEMGSSSINWAVRVWVNSPDFWVVKDRLTRNVKVALDEAKIGIPFPQMDVHLDGVLRRVE